MGHSSIPVDLFNPGQVFACVGMAEVALLELGASTRVRFDEDEQGTRFVLIADHDDPLAFVDGWLRSATLRIVRPAGAGIKEVSGIETRELLPGEPFPVSEAKSDIVPLEIVGASGRLLSLHHWAEDGGAVKWYAGMAGYSGAALFRDALGRLPEAFPPLPFDYPSSGRSTAGFDARSIRVALDAGTTNTGTLRTYPYVDAWATVGLVFARPFVVGRYEHRYAVPVGGELPIALLRTILGCGTVPISRRTFRYQLVRPPGMYSRCIQSVIEETEQ